MAGGQQVTAQPAGGNKGAAQSPAGPAPAAAPTPVQQTPYQQAAGAQQGALNATNMAMQQNLNPGMFMQQNDPTTASAMGNYYNPFTQQVVNNTANTMERQRQTALAQNQANAAQAGAFGGGRHGVVDAVTNARVNENLGNMAGQQFQQMFNTAAQLGTGDVARQNAINQYNAGQVRQSNQALAGQAGQLAGLGQQSFGYGTTLDDRMMQQGAMQQDVAQNLMGQAAGMFDQYVGSPGNTLNMRLAALGANPLNNAGTQTTKKQLGLLDVLGGVGAAAGGVGAAMGKSSAQYKQNIRPAAPPEDLWKLEPKAYDWQEGQQPDPFGQYDMQDYGLIAEEVHAVFPEATVTNNQGGVEGLKVLPLIGALFAEVKRLREIVDGDKLQP